MPDGRVGGCICAQELYLHIFIYIQHCIRLQSPNIMWDKQPRHNSDRPTDLITTIQIFSAAAAGLETESERERESERIQYSISSADTPPLLIVIELNDLIVAGSVLTGVLLFTCWRAEYY